MRGTRTKPIQERYGSVPRWTVWVFLGVVFAIAILVFPFGAGEKPEEASPAVAAATPPPAPPSGAFKRANWSAPKAKAEPEAPRSLLYRKRAPRVPPESLANLEGTEVVFTGPPEEER